MTRKMKRQITFWGFFLAIVILAGFVMNLYGVFDEKTSNPDNLVGVARLEDNYIEADTYNTGYGIKVKVNELGVVKVTGTATADVSFDLIPSGISLEADKTYTLSCGNDNVTYKGFVVRLKNITTSSDADRYVYADLDGTFTVKSSSDVYKLEVFVRKDTKINETFYPVLVEGKAAGEFYK